MAACQLPKLDVAGSIPVSRSICAGTPGLAFLLLICLLRFLNPMPLPLVVIVGRPNVGKSTIFNRIIRKQAAVVDPTPGVTRDRNYAETEWNGVRFTLVDTGGYLPPGHGGELAAAVTEQTLIAADQADVVLFVIDAMSGVTDVDRALSKIVHRKGTPVLYIANKIDDSSQIALAYESTGLGLGDPAAASARTGYLFAEMLDELVDKIEALGNTSEPQPVEEELALAVIGAPNTGKSSLVNRLSGDERMVVSDIPGTTRDAIDLIIKYHGKSIRLIDTAGLKRKRFGQKGLEFYMTLRSIRAIERSEVAVVMIDATQGFTQGDFKLINQAEDAGVGIIAAINKWDAIETGPKSGDEWLAEWRRRMPAHNWIPLVFISALTGQRAIKVIEYALEAKAQREKRIPTPELNETIGAILKMKPPPAVKGKVISFKYITQVSTAPPHFRFFASHCHLIQKPYRRFIENQIRSRYGFTGAPLRLSFRGK